MIAAPPKIWIISGDREAGKTSFCRKIILEARSQGFSPAGVLSPAVFTNGIKTAIEAEDIASGQKRLLATRRDEVPDAITRRWKFDEEALKWGAKVLAASTPCDLLIVDELGPLELEHNLGWIEGIQAVNSARYQTAVVVIRTELLANAQQRWPRAGIISLAHSDSPKKIAQAARQIFQGLQRH